MDKGNVFPLAAAAATALEPGRLSAEIFRHGSLELRYYAPQGTDTQTPHDRDELYVVASGAGEFVDDSGRRPVGTGDCIFVAAAATHRFESFTEDFAVWVMFYGPDGGEAGTTPA